MNLNENLVGKLRRSGCKVKVTHSRLFYCLDDNKRPVVKSFESFNTPHPLRFAIARGGSTHVEITLPNGETLESQSQCSTKDQFCKRYGTNKAILKVWKFLSDSVK